MHHISKSIYLRQIKLTYSYSASQNLSEKHEEISGGCRGLNIPSYIITILVIRHGKTFTLCHNPKCYHELKDQSTVAAPGRILS